jgi:MbtH protein
MKNTDSEARPMRVVVNEDGQYSVYPEGVELAPGWHAVGVSGDGTACSAYIEKHWTDLRPLRLRKSVEAHS